MGLHDISPSVKRDLVPIDARRSLAQRLVALMGPGIVLVESCECDSEAPWL